MDGQSIPVTQEEDMGKVRDVLDKALDTISGILTAKLAAQVEALQGQVQSLQHSIESVQQTNKWLDEQTVTLRSQRDEAIHKANSTQAELDHAKQDVDNLRATVDRDAQTITDLRNQLSQALRERDDHGIRAMELEDELHKHKAQIGRLKELAQAEFGLQEPPKPQPVPTIVHSTEVVQAVAQDHPDPAPMPATGTHGPWDNWGR